MEQYSVLHMVKLKELGGIGKHLDRTYTQHNVDSSKSHLNEELSNWPHVELDVAVTSRIKEGYKKQSAIRQDAVRAVSVMLTGSHEQMKKIENDQKLFEQWKEANYQFACQHFGKSNIVRFSVHRDEKTPHIHCVFVPITKEGGLSAKAYMNGRDFLQSYQDQYGKAMEEFGLSRGLSKYITQDVHIPTSDYYRETSKLIREAEEKTSEIKTSNILNLKKVRQSIEGELVKGYRLALDYKQKAEQHERTYKSFSDRSIEQNLDQVKREVNLVQHLASMGYTLDNRKSCRNYAVMEKDADKLIVRTSPNRSGHWVYMSATDNKDKGTIIDLMLNRGYNYRDIQGLTSKHLDDNVWKQVISDQKLFISDKEMQSRLAQEYLSNVKADTKWNYLEKRGINASTYNVYEGDRIKVGKSAVFGLYQELDEKFDGRTCSTITYYFNESEESNKRFQYGLPRGVSVLKETNDSQQVIIMESPVDALSHKQLYGGQAIYVCTCGNITTQIKEELTQVIKGVKSNNKELWLSFDNDEAGKKMQEQVKKMAENIGVIVKSTQPLAMKDWNEELMQNHIKIERRDNVKMGKSMRL